MTSKQVNIFDFATSELSHDAILCYILSCFDSEDDNERIVSRRYYSKILKINSNEIDTESISNFLVRKQFPVFIEKSKKVGSIDALLTFNFNSKEYVLVIENKTDSKEHNNQLIKYQSYISREFANHEKFFLLYSLRLHSELFKNKVNEKGWMVIDRNEIHELLNASESNQSILGQYNNFINSMVTKSKSFTKLPLSQWKDITIEGFLYKLEQSRIFSNFHFDGINGFIKNRGRGYLNIATFNNQKLSFYDYTIELYVQLEFSVKKDESHNLEKVISIIMSFVNDKSNNQSLNERGNISTKLKKEYREMIKSYLKSKKTELTPFKISNRNEKEIDYSTAKIASLEIKEDLNEIELLDRIIKANNKYMLLVSILSEIIMPLSD